MLDIQAKHDSTNIATKFLLFCHTVQFGAFAHLWICCYYHQVLPQVVDVLGCSINRWHWNLSHESSWCIQQRACSQKSFDECDHCTSFKEGWVFVSKQFNILVQFCSRLTSNFANTPILESFCFCFRVGEIWVSTIVDRSIPWKDNASEAAR